MLSPAGRCRPFGNADGTVAGEGAGAVLLTPLREAVERGDFIYGVIRGSAINHGGRTNGYTVPDPQAQAHLIRAALTAARVDARTISYVEAHGTGTKLGDPIEVAGLTTAFRDQTPDTGFCAIRLQQLDRGGIERIGAHVLAARRLARAALPAAPRPGPGATGRAPGCGRRCRRRARRHQSVSSCSIVGSGVAAGAAIGGQNRCMSKLWLRRVALGVFGVAVLIAAGVAWFVASFDADRYKGLAIDWMQREHDRTLAIDGPVRLSVLPRARVQLSKLRLSEHGRSDSFASIDEVGLAVELLPLLSRQLVIERVSAKGVRAVYTRNAKGQRNIDDLLGVDAKARDKANDTTGAAPPPAALKFDIRRIDLEDLRASVHDAMIPLDGDITLVSLKSGRLASGVASPVSSRRGSRCASRRSAAGSPDRRSSRSMRRAARFRPAR